MKNTFSIIFLLSLLITLPISLPRAEGCNCASNPSDDANSANESTAISPDNGCQENLKEIGAANTCKRACFLACLKKKRESAKDLLNGSGTSTEALVKNIEDIDRLTLSTLNLKDDGKIESTSKFPFKGNTPRDKLGNTLGRTGSASNSLPGSSTFEECQALVGDEWKDIVKEVKPSGTVDQGKLKNLFKQKWANLINEAQNEITKSIYRPKLSDEKDEVKEKLQRYSGEVRSFLEHGYETFTITRKCTAGILLTSAGVDYNESEELSPRTSSAYDGLFTCRSTGPETQDYNDCYKLVQAYNIAQISDKAIETIQATEYKISADNRQAEAAEDLADGNHAALLEMQRDDLRKQSEVAAVRAGVDGAKASVLTSAILDYITIDNVISSCQNGIGEANSVQTKNFSYYLAYLMFHDTFLGELKTHYGETLENVQLNHEHFPLNGDAKEYAGTADLCLASAHNGFVLIGNEQARDKAKEAAVKAGLEMVENSGKAIILENQAQRVDDAITDVESFEPQTVSFGEVENLTTKCQADPNAEGCDQFDFSSRSGLVNPNFSIDAGAQGMGGISGATLDEGQDGLAATSDSTDRSDVVDSIGSAVNDVGSVGGFESRAPGAGAIKSGGSVGGGGGGGGGASAGGLPGGGGGGGGAAQTPSQRIAAMKKQYSGGKSSFTYGGGNFASSKSKSGGGNPLKDLLKRKKGRGNSKTLNFGRQPASIGNKTSNLWTTISNRYQKENQKKKLLIYK